MAVGIGALPRLARAGVASVERRDIDTYAETGHCFSYRRATHAGEDDYGRLEFSRGIQQGDQAFKGMKAQRLRIVRLTQDLLPYLRGRAFISQLIVQQSGQSAPHH